MLSCPVVRWFGYLDAVAFMVYWGVKSNFVECYFCVKASEERGQLPAPVKSENP